MGTNHDLSDLEAAADAAAEPARGLFREALTCFRAGALRAALSVAWSAVIADLLTKLQRLDAAGPDPLKARVAGNPTLGVLRSRGHSDPVDALHLESSLLAAAETDFDMLSPAERHELTRLARDRHHSVHPSMLPLAEGFLPSAELVHAHLRAVAGHLLRRGAIQGVHALDALWLELDSDHFPRDGRGAEAYLRDSPICTARPGTVRGAVIELVRRALADLRPPAERARYHAALVALLRIHEAVAVDALASTLTPTIAHLDDSHLGNVVALLAAVDRGWSVLGASARARTVNYVAGTVGPHLVDVLHDALAVPELLATARARVDELGPRPLLALLERGDRVACCDRVIALTIAAEELVEAERLAVPLIPPIARALDATQAVRLIGAIADRDPLFQSWKIIGGVLPACFDDLRRHAGPLAEPWARLYRRMLGDLVPEKSARLRALLLDLYPALDLAA